MFSLLFHRARQRPTTRGTATPGELKALRRPRVVLRRGTSLMSYPRPHTRPHPEPLALPRTVSLAKQGNTKPGMMEIRK
ncbi:hypothetical protein GOODEAATRI_029180 [Goodea atripinnis]|uniref:Uncharacterized protein n=1 Tax=Goodea atripinnis TaxID=208336 RepID=A0ABV0NGX5_9TELE